MNPVAWLHDLWKHCRWADGKLLAALVPHPDATPAWREYGHVLAAEELWLARLAGREPTVGVWPELTPEETRELSERVSAAFGSTMNALEPEVLDRSIPYVTSTGDRFESRVGDILVHLFLHGQYHRGKVNLLLRQAGYDPAPVDFIALVRGYPAAVTPIDPLP